MTLTVTTNLPGRYCTLTVAGAAPDVPVTLWRDDINGTRRVRLQPGATTDASGGFVTTDHEAALTGPLTYSTDRAAWTPPASLADATRPPGLYVHVAADPTQQLGPLTLLDRRLTTDTGAVLHVVIGRRDSLDTGTVGRLRVGDLEILHDTWSAAAALEALILPRPTTLDSAPATRRTLMLRQQEWPGLDGLYRVTRHQLARGSAGRKWLTTLGVDETLTGPPLETTP